MNSSVIPAPLLTRRKSLFLTAVVLRIFTCVAPAADLPPLKDGAKLALEEDWSQGIRAEKWYVLRRHWGDGHHGVVPENVRVQQETDGSGRSRSVLVCEAHGDRYEGPVKGLYNRADRVGGVI